MLRRPFILSALAVTALLALAAFAANTRPLGTAGRRNDSLPSSLFDYTFTTLLIVAVVGFVVVARFVPVGVGPGERRPFPARVIRTVVLGVIGVLFALMLRHLILTHFLHNLLHLSPKLGVNGHGGGKKPHLPSGQTRNVNFRWDELLAIAGLGLLLVAAFFVLRPRPGGRREWHRPETLEEAISESLDDLRTDPDLRRAIEAAYARMERALAATGLPRDPAEAPNEYLERALLSVDAGRGAARRLTELFERVKFSQHEPEPGMRDDAIDALVAIRDELRAGEAVAA